MRFVGAADLRVAEDWLRALRFFRFHAHFGRGALDPEGLAAARGSLAGVAGLSRERVRHELLRLLEAPDPTASLAGMAETGLLAVVLPAGSEVDRCARLVALERDLNQSPDALLRLAALLRGDAEALEREGRRLRLSNTQSATLVALRRLADDIEKRTPADRATTLDHDLYRSGALTVRRALLLAAAEPEKIDGDALAALLDRSADWVPVAFPLGGRDLLKRGVAAGPAVGKMMVALEDWWLDAGRAPDRAACLAELEARLTRFS